MLGNEKQHPVIKGASYFLAHTPGLVRQGSKPARELARQPGLLATFTSHLRPYDLAAAYPPNRAFLGSVYPDCLTDWEKPWYNWERPVERWHPLGEIMPEHELLGLLKVADLFDLVWLEEDFSRWAKSALAVHPLVEATEIQNLDDAHPLSDIEQKLAEDPSVLPLHLGDGRLVGCIRRAHEEDTSLTAEVLLEKLACKATAAMSLRALLHTSAAGPMSIDYIINSGEEAVGERYQRGGGNLAKAVGEMCGLENASGSDVKAFCCGPVHALMLAGALVSSGVFRQVAVVGGGSLAKLGMKFQGHLAQDQWILEDVLASVAILVGEDDGVSPVLRLDSVGKHNIGAGSSQQAIFQKLVSEPLDRLGLSFRDVDKYATELHNPEVTEPSGNGNVPSLNYRLIGALAVRNGEIGREELPDFVLRHGMPGFAPTQGHIASAVPFLGHAVKEMRADRMRRAMFLAKGSLFLGRMTQMSDGISLIVEPNPAAKNGRV